MSYRAQGELTRCRKPGAPLSGGFYDSTEHKRIAVGTDLQHVLTRVRVRRPKKRDYHLVDFLARGPIPRANPRNSMLKVRVRGMGLEKSAGKVAASVT